MKKTAMKKSLDAILFGIILVVLMPVALAYFAYQWAVDALSNTSALTFDSECRGRIIGSDDSMSRFIFYNEETGRHGFQEVCVFDISAGAVEFYHHPAGYKNRQSLGTHISLNSRFTALPPELAELFKGHELPRFKFSPEGLIIVKRDYENVKVARLPYTELGLSRHGFAHWPEDAFAGFTPGAQVKFSRIYYDDNELASPFQREIPNLPPLQCAYLKPHGLA